MKFTTTLKQLTQVLAVASGLRKLLPPIAEKIVDLIGAGVAGIQELAAALRSARARVTELDEIRKDLRDELRDELNAIKRTAEAIAVEEPELDPRKFRFPGNGDQRLLTAARSIAADVAPISEQFVAHALNTNFLDRLNGRIEQFHSTLTECAAAARTVDELELRIRSAMREAQGEAKRLDPVVRNVVGDDAVALAAWDKVCFGRKRRRARRGKEAARIDTAEAAGVDPGFGDADTETALAPEADREAPLQLAMAEVEP